MSWKNICKDKSERPKVQDYKKWQDLPPIPISLPTHAMQTGEWRTYRPVVIKSKCTKCGFCWMYCPEGTILEDEGGYYKFDYDYCKGCGICAYECPSKAIEMKLEDQSQKEEEPVRDI